MLRGFKQIIWICLTHSEKTKIQKNEEMVEKKDVKGTLKQI